MPRLSSPKLPVGLIPGKAGPCLSQTTHLSAIGDEGAAPTFILQARGPLPPFVSEPGWLRLVALDKELLHHFVEFVVTEWHLYFRWPLFSGTFASNRCVERRPERPVPQRLWGLS